MVAFNAVVLPAPLRPSRATTSPAASSRLKLKSTCARPYPAFSCFSSSMGRCLAEVDPAHARVGTHFGRCTVGDKFAFGEHDHTVCIAEDDVHVVFREEHGQVCFP